MKEKENTVPTTRKKKLVYSVIVAVCALLLIVATVLTVYFVANNGREVLETPPADEEGDPPVSLPPDEGNEPSDPTGGESVAFILPVEGASSTVSHNAYYGNTTTNKWYFHDGTDYAAEEGASVRAVADGEIVSIDLSERLGNLLTIKHADGVESTYRFIEPVEGLKVGDTVKQGQIIAKVAAAYGTEAKDGVHLHFEMRVSGKLVDPVHYLDVVLEEK